ncbi:hypothetical protein SELMODRAFT_418179 [Selaginella moellendorffii]|uniref:Uncharacterized protein n=1 Tax=Selaginella moellendorffii TaxID=88036 RepID=D8S4X7_SELML|nr:hypothetical protein SELMODRAFT_418179 [Selaginella moellendorffii]
MECNESYLLSSPFIHAVCSKQRSLGVFPPCAERQTACLLELVQYSKQIELEQPGLGDAAHPHQAASLACVTSSSAENAVPVAIHGLSCGMAVAIHGLCHGCYGLGNPWQLLAKAGLPRPWQLCLGGILSVSTIATLSRRKIAGKDVLVVGSRGEVGRCIVSHEFEEMDPSVKYEQRWRCTTGSKKDDDSVAGNFASRRAGCKQENDGGGRSRKR